VFKVGGKVFLLTTQVPGRAVVTAKCARSAQQSWSPRIRKPSPGYHLHKRHWLSVWAGDDVPEDLIRDLVENSYRLVATALPVRVDRPRPPSSGPGPTPSGTTEDKDARTAQRRAGQRHGSTGNVARRPHDALVAVRSGCVDHLRHRSQ